jgi:hypothetical protein
LPPAHFLHKLDRVTELSHQRALQLKKLCPSDEE